MRKPFLYTYLFTDFVIGIHLFIIKDIIRLSLKIDEFNSTKFIVGISALATLAILIYYKKNKLMETKFSKEELEHKIIPIIVYMSIVLVISVVLSFIKWGKVIG
jgi:uncharacterized membrane protein YidH (DUF202 family)